MVNRAILVVTGTLAAQLRWVWREVIAGSHLKELKLTADDLEKRVLESPRTDSQNFVNVFTVGLVVGLLVVIGCFIYM